jgi:hypothetical protein
MRDVAVVGVVLGLGCVVVFALAAATSMLFPNGALVSSGYWGGKGGVFMEAPMAVPAVDPVVIEMPADGAEK